MARRRAVRELASVESAPKTAHETVVARSDSQSSPRVEPAAKSEESAKSDLIGVRKSWTRQYVAGLAIKHFGLNAGVTDEMCDWVDEHYGKANKVESWGCLNRAWHSIRAYTGEIVSDKPVAEEEKSTETARAVQAR